MISLLDEYQALIRGGLEELHQFHYKEYLKNQQEMETNKKITRENITESLIDYMLALIGKTRVEMVETYNYKFDFTMTRKQYEAFYRYSIFVLQKTFHFRKAKAVSNFEWFWKHFGIRLKG